MKFNKLTPNFLVKNVAESVQFYKEILGFKLEIAVPDGTTRIENEILDNEEYASAMVSKDEVYLMFLNETNFKCVVPTLNQFPQGASVLFYIDFKNIKEIYTQIENQVEVVNERNGVKEKWGQPYLTFNIHAQRTWNCSNPLKGGQAVLQRRQA